MSKYPEVTDIETMLEERDRRIKVLLSELDISRGALENAQENVAKWMHYCKTLESVNKAAEERITDYEDGIGYRKDKSPEEAAIAYREVEGLLVGFDERDPDCL